MTSKDLIGRGSGESGQLAFNGEGMVVVQPAGNMRYGGQRQDGEQQQQQESSPL